MSLDVDRIPRWAPGPQARVDWSHPLAQGLVFCTVDGYNDAAGRAPITAVNNPGHGLLPTGPGRTFTAASTQYLSVPLTPQLTIVNQISIAAWAIRTDAGTGGEQLVAQDVNGSRCFTVDFSGTAIRFYVAGGGTAANQVDTPAFTTASGVPFAVVATAINGGAMNLYINGSLGVTNTGNATFNATPTNAWNIGRREFSGAEGYFTGTIGPVMIFRRALSIAEVGALYADPFCMLREE